jgi:hypothetical protein
MKVIHWSIAHVLLTLSTGCRSSSVQHVPFPSQDVNVTSDDVARIYFMRGGYVGAQRRPIVVLEAEQEMGSLSPGTYLCWERPAGRTLGQAFYKSADPLRGNLEAIVDLECEAGEVFYYLVHVERAEGQPVVKQLSTEEGQAMVADRKPATHAD